MNPDRQPSLPFNQTVELVRDLESGETTLRTSRRRRKISQRRIPSLRERAQALSRWQANCNFEVLLARGAEAYRSGEANKIAITSGINTEFGAGIGARDDADFALKDAFAETRFKTINTFDIVRQIKRTTMGLRNRSRFGSDWFEGYVDRVVGLLGEEKGLSAKTIDKYKTYLHSPELL